MAWRRGDWKLIENLEDGGLALYHLGYDLGETTDLSEAFADKARELHALLKAWQRDTGAEFPRPNPNFNPQRRREWAQHPDRAKVVPAPVLNNKPQGTP